MSKFDGLYSIRDGTKDDFKFIMATFLRGLYYGESWFSTMPKAVFMDNYKHVAERIITSPSTAVTVACLPDDPTVVLGYSILSSDYQDVHWVYVKKVWRNRGIARTLLPKHPAKVTHLTDLGKKLLTKLNNPVFDPFMKEL